MLWLLVLSVPAFRPLQTVATTVTTEAGVELVSFHYKEPGSASMREDGSMLGVCAALTYDFNKNMMVRVDMSYDWGTVRYDGWLIDFNTGERLTPVQLDSPNSIFNLRIVGGRRFRMNFNSMTITPLAGIGFRYLVNELPGIGGYTREQSYWYLPVGVEGSGSFQKGWGYVIRAEYDYFLSGSNVSGGDTFSQDSGYGFRASAGVSYSPAGKGALPVLVEPYVQYWSVDDSTVTTDGWFEPANNCTEYGVKCSVRF